MGKQSWTIVAICVITAVATLLALPEKATITSKLLTSEPRDIYFPKPRFTLPGGKEISFNQPLKLGLDIKGGMQVVLQTDMSQIPDSEKDQALSMTRDILYRRVDMYGIAEPVVQTARIGEERRLIVELPGVTDPDAALALVGKTAQLDFRLVNEAAVASQSAMASESAQVTLSVDEQFIKTDLTGKDLEKATVQLDSTTSEPVILLTFTERGRELFAKITSDNVGEILGIFIDDYPVVLPQISSAILDGNAQMTGSYTMPEAQQLAVQLNAGALPVPISVVEQRTIGASLGEQSVRDSVTAGLVGLLLVLVFMILLYGVRGVVASVALVVYAVITIALYKLMGVTLTLPGIAGLLLSIGMAVDANILIFERMKEERRRGRNFRDSVELGFGRAWDSIKDANLATIITSLVLINPFRFGLLNTSGLVRGFGITLFVGVLISLFTGVIVSRNLLRLVVPLLEKFDRSEGKK